MTRIYAFVILFFYSLSSAQAAELFSANHLVDDIGSLSIMSIENDVISGDFEQTRHVAGMSVIIRSSGDFIVDPSLGLLWNQTVPFPSRLWMDQQRMVQKIGIAEPIEITANQNPLPFTIGRIFFALFRGDFQGLKNTFKPYLMMADGGWQLGLQPDDELIAKVIKQIVVTGDKQLEKISIIDVKGNRQELVFKALTHTPELTAEQYQRMKHK